MCLRVRVSATNPHSCDTFADNSAQMRNLIVRLTHKLSHTHRILLRDGCTTALHREYVLHCDFDSDQRNELLHGALCVWTHARHKRAIRRTDCFITQKTRLPEALTCGNTQKLISKMDQLTNLPVFKSIQISLACQACIDAEKTHEWYGCACYWCWPQCSPELSSVLTYFTPPTWQSAHVAFDSAVGVGGVD